MRHIFAKTHPLCEPQWLSVVESNDQLLNFHRWISVTLFLKYGMDPHLIGENGKAKDSIGEILHPVRLGALWLTSALRFFMRDGFFYVNRSGGIAPTNIEIIKEIDSDEMPKGSPIQGEIVKVTKWSGGHHFYCHSSAGRLFPFEKCWSADEVRKQLEKYAPGCKIEFTPNPRNFNQGD